MNFHDKIYELVKCFKETNEYKEYMMLKEKIKSNDEEYKILKEFKEKQIAHQTKIINGEKVEESETTDMQNLYSILIQKEDLRKILECEMRINLLLGDMQKIIAEGIKEIVEF